MKLNGVLSVLGRQIRFENEMKETSSKENLPSLGFHRSSLKSIKLYFKKPYTLDHHNELSCPSYNIKKTNQYVDDQKDNDDLHDAGPRHQELHGHVSAVDPTRGQDRETREALGVKVENRSISYASNEYRV